MKKISLMIQSKLTRSALYKALAITAFSFSTLTPAYSADLEEEATLPEQAPKAVETSDGPSQPNLIEASISEPEPTPMSVLPLDEVRMFTEVLNRIRSAYVEPIDDKTLLENAIKGMLAGIDPHSTYLTDAAFDSLQETTNGEFGGLGIEVGTEDGYIKIISPLDDSPADKAGLEAGDLIILLDGTPSRDITIGDTVDIMRGDPGTDIVLTIIREGINEPFEVTVTRDIIEARSIRTRELEPGYGYIRISQFSVKTGDEVKKAVKQLHEDNEDMKGLVLDLRNNPGGVLQASVSVVDTFISEGLIVYTEGRVENSEMRFEATPENLSQGIPLIVLINEGSASASEIVAGALQDHNRGIIMGTQSFGKGSVQTILPLTNDRAIKLTTALYFTPNGRSIQALGITPDILVDRGRVSSIPVSLAAYREEDLTNHLGNANEDEENSEKLYNQDTEVIVSDYQLNEALNVLKGLSIVKALEAQTYAAALIDKAPVEETVIESDETIDQ